MKKLAGKLSGIRAARLRTKVGELDRTLIVVESPELLKGQKRGIEQALAKARPELETLQRQVQKGRIKRSRLKECVAKTLKRDHLSAFIVVDIGGSEDAPTMSWRVDDARRKQLEETRLGRRVLCTDQHRWRTARIIAGFRGQWKVEELFRRAKKGVGAVKPVERRLASFAYLCHRARLDVGKSGQARAPQRGIGRFHDGEFGKDQGNDGPDEYGWTRTTSYALDRARANRGTS
jgi:hypothetical protein